jgi:dynein heavy chain
VLNPKSVTMGEMYGDINASRASGPTACCQISRATSGADANVNADRQWIVFDGPVDAIWIENMNTVLDDNKMLCLVQR